MTNSINDPTQPVDYSSTAAPESYKCGGCGRTGVKLWREYQTFLDHQSLRCADCAAADQGRDITSMDDRGRYNGEHGRTDQIGWLVPAVPTAANDTFWGYTSVPSEGCAWWERLPVR